MIHDGTLSVSFKLNFSSLYCGGGWLSRFGAGGSELDGNWIA